MVQVLLIPSCKMLSSFPLILVVFLLSMQWSSTSPGHTGLCPPSEDSTEQGIMPNIPTYNLLSSWLLPVLITTLQAVHGLGFGTSKGRRPFLKGCLNLALLTRWEGLEVYTNSVPCCMAYKPENPPLPSMLSVSSIPRALVTKTGQGLLWWGPASAWPLLISGILSILLWKYLILGDIYLFQWSGHVAGYMANTSSYSWFLKCTPFYLE